MNRRRISWQYTYDNGHHVVDQKVGLDPGPGAILHGS